MKKAFTLIELMIVIAIIAIIAAIAIPNLLEARKSANETNAIASLKTYHTAQSLYKERGMELAANGRTKIYARNLYYLYKSPDDVDRTLIPEVFAAASLPISPYQGYIFVGPGTSVGAPDANGIPTAVTPYEVGNTAAAGANSAVTNVPLNWANNFELFGTPVEYDTSGNRTFFVNVQGTVKTKDLQATFDNYGDLQTEARQSDTDNPMSTDETDRTWLDA